MNIHVLIFMWTWFFISMGKKCPSETVLNPVLIQVWGPDQRPVSSPGAAVNPQPASFLTRPSCSRTTLQGPLLLWGQVPATGDSLQTPWPSGRILVSPWPRSLRNLGSICPHSCSLQLPAGPAGSWPRPGELEGTRPALPPTPGSAHCVFPWIESLNLIMWSKGAFDGLYVTALYINCQTVPIVAVPFYLSASQGMWVMVLGSGVFFPDVFYQLEEDALYF